MKHLNQIAVSDFTIPAEIGTNLRFVFLSDLHGCDNDPIMDILADIKPDAVLVGGDFIHDNRRYQEGFDFLRQSARLYPTFCSIGNHELRFKGDLTAEIHKTGAVSLDNSSVLFKGVQIGGLTSALKEQRNLKFLLTRQVPDLTWLDSFANYPGYKILLSHHPEYFDKYVRQLPIDLILAGHAHGGQWRAFNRGLYAFGQGFLPKYSAGIYENRMIVSKGVGNGSFIPRINNIPDLLDIHLSKNMIIPPQSERIYSFA